MTKFERYEAEKSKLQRMGLTPAEYEQALRELCRKLKI